MSAESDSTPQPSFPSRLFRARGLRLAGALVAIYVALAPLHTQDGANHRQVAVLLERLVSAEVQDPVYESNLSLLRTNILFSGGYALAAAKVGIPIHVYPEPSLTPSRFVIRRSAVCGSESDVDSTGYRVLRHRERGVPRRPGGRCRQLDDRRQEDPPQ